MQPQKKRARTRGALINSGKAEVAYFFPASRWALSTTRNIWMHSQNTPLMQAAVSPLQSMIIFGSEDGTWICTKLKSRAKNAMTSTASTARLRGESDFFSDWAMAGKERDNVPIVHGKFGPRGSARPVAIHHDFGMDEVRFSAARGHEEVVFDPHAAEVAMLFGQRPIHAVVEAFASRQIVEQGGDKIETGLNRHNVVGRQRQIHAERAEARPRILRAAGLQSAAVARP